MDAQADVVSEDPEDPDREKLSSPLKSKKKGRKRAKKRKKRRPEKKKHEAEEDVQSSYIEHVEVPLAPAGQADTRQDPLGGPGFEDLYQGINDELATLRDTLAQHQNQMVGDASTLIRMIPHPPPAYVTRLCCCTRCCGRCCDIYGHQKPVHHSRPKTANVGTDSNDKSERSSTWAPMTGAAISTDTMLADVIDALVREYVTDQKNADVEIARHLLKACQVPLSSDEERLKDMKKMFHEYFGISWPIEAHVDPTLPDIWVVAGQLVKDLNLHLLATVSVDVHPERRTRYMVGVDEPHLLYRLNLQRGRLADLVASSIQESLSLMAKHVDFDEIASSIKAAMVSINNLVTSPTVRYLGSENYRVSPLNQLDKGVTSLVKTVFAGYAGISVNTEVLVKSPSYFRKLATLGSLEARGVLNYLGFRILVHFGAFMSSSSLQQVRSVILGYSVSPYGLDIKKICSREVERAVPAMYLRAFALRQKRTGFDTMARMWAAQVEDRFQSGLSRLFWIHGDKSNARDSTDLRLARFKLSLSKLLHFYPYWVLNNDSYQAYVYDLRRDLASVDKNRVIQLRRALLQALQQEKIELLVSGVVGRTITGSLFDTLPSYDAQKNSVFVPAAVMNHSVPTRGSLFAFHIARFGVRIFKGLLPVIYNDFVFSDQKNDDMPMLFSDAYQRRLQQTVRCLLDTFRKTPEFLKSNFLRNLDDVTAAGFPFLEQTVALIQAFSAFQELLNIKRVWKSDFRFSRLPLLSAEQLFFVYYALDNCEASDDDYRSEMFETRFALPPEDRVNFPLLQFEEFQKAFACPRSSPMSGTSRCAVVT
ncbi:unnamed protein product [Ixodes hexagonus]